MARARIIGWQRENKQHIFAVFLRAMRIILLRGFGCWTILFLCCCCSVLMCCVLMNIGTMRGSAVASYALTKCQEARAARRIFIICQKRYGGIYKQRELLECASNEDTDARKYIWLNYLVCGILAAKVVRIKKTICAQYMWDMPNWFAKHDPYRRRK